MSDEGFAALQELKGGDIDAAKLSELMNSRGVPPADYVAGTALDYMESNYDRERTKRLVAQLQGALDQLTDAGGVVRDVAGHPIAAYSAVTAGGALGTRAAMELAAMMQAEKESELPLS